MELKLHRYVPLDTGKEWKIENIQPFFPTLEALFKTEQVKSLPHYGVRLREEVKSIVDKDEVVLSSGRKTKVHRKTTMILSPFKWMRGDYGGCVGVPKPETMAQDMQKVLQNHHTAGYVGALASILLSETGCPHFPRVYGVYTGLATEHVIDVSDDYEDLSEKSWFLDNLGKTFELKFRTPEQQEVFTHTRTARRGLLLSEEEIELHVEEEEADHVSNPASRREGDLQSYGSSVATSVTEDEQPEEDENVFEILSCQCEEDEEGEEQDDDDDGEPFAWATFRNVPVITTVMEVCEGTFYDLLEQYPTDVAKHVAWIGQIVMALWYAQRKFHLIHNDLHGNNVMWVRTTQEYLYYKYVPVNKNKPIYYRIPTYGYIMKIIDFDRATYSVRLSGMKKARFFMSSHFDVDEEAAGQYNCEPFYDASHPPIYPNTSFDLTRLATSLYWDMFQEGSASQHPLEKLFRQWMTQEDDTSVMFRRDAKEENHDRYHGFDLYKAIARYCRRAVPDADQLTYFKVESVPLDVSVVMF